MATTEQLNTFVERYNRLVEAHDVRRSELGASSPATKMLAKMIEIDEHVMPIAQKAMRGNIISFVGHADSITVCFKWHDDKNGAHDFVVCTKEDLDLFRERFPEAFVGC